VAEDGPAQGARRVADAKQSIPRIGTAGWSVPSAAAGAFGTEGSQLQRYASVFSCAEINSSFYRPHRADTYARWAASVSSDFRFAVKLPRAITHEARLHDAQRPLATFFEQVGCLSAALGPILIQLPPSLKFDAAQAEVFLRGFREAFTGKAVLEPRHITWFDPHADALLRAYSIGRVAADPAPHPNGTVPGGWTGLRYWRLHGSPRTYYTEYGVERLRAVSRLLTPDDWCIFDNTASGAAITDALRMQEMLLGPDPVVSRTGASALATIAVRSPAAVGVDQSDRH
jgi:uncharacterized protein YecE (DUF72 family)